VRHRAQGVGIVHRVDVHRADRLGRARFPDDREAHPRTVAPELDDAAVAQRGLAVHAAAIDVGAVGAAEIADRPDAVMPGERGMPAGDHAITLGPEADVRLRRSPEHRAALPDDRRFADTATRQVREACLHAASRLSASAAR
jgi:hypothetical protein